MVTELNAGSAFGELALLSADATRQATVVCNTNVLMATLDRNNFNNCLTVIEQRKKIKITNFLSGIPNFVGLKKSSLLRFTKELTKAKYYRNQFVYQEGETINCLFIVLKGEFELSRKLKRNDQSLGL